MVSNQCTELSKSNSICRPTDAKLPLNAKLKDQVQSSYAPIIAATTFCQRRCPSVFIEDLEALTKAIPPAATSNPKAEPAASLEAAPVNASIGAVQVADVGQAAPPDAHFVAFEELTGFT
jgi:hypothetical protein